MGVTGFARSDGLRVRYRAWGEPDERTPILLMHGWGASLESNWERPGWIRRLSGLGRVVGFDVRGHGDSDKPHDVATYGYAGMARDALAVLDALGIGKAHFLGHSLGAFSGVCLLARHPERLAACVWMGIGDETEESLAAVSVIAKALRARSPEEVVHPLGRAYRTFVDADPRNDRECLAISAIRMWPEGFPRELGGAALSRVTSPVLVLNGSEDRPYVESDEKLVAAIPGARLARIAGADHLGPATDPRFQDEAVAFLESVQSVQSASPSQQ